MKGADIFVPSTTSFKSHTCVFPTLRYKAEKVRGKARGESSAAEAEAEAGCSTEAQRRIPNFFKATKHISSRTIHMVSGWPAGEKGISGLAAPLRVESGSEVLCFIVCETDLQSIETSLHIIYL